MTVSYVICDRCGKKMERFGDPLAKNEYITLECTGLGVEVKSDYRIREFDICCDCAKEIFANLFKDGAK